MHRRFRVCDGDRFCSDDILSSLLACKVIALLLDILYRVMIMSGVCVGGMHPRDKKNENKPFRRGRNSNAQSQNNSMTNFITRFEKSRRGFSSLPLSLSFSPHHFSCYDIFRFIFTFSNETEPFAESQKKLCQLAHLTFSSQMKILFANKSQLK